jgi:hypothetical protein
MGENLRSYDYATMGLCNVLFLETPLLEKLDFYCYLGGVCIATTRNKSL